MSKKSIFWVFMLVFSLVAQNAVKWDAFPKTKDGALLAWVIFKDKGDQQVDLFKVTQVLSPKAIERRTLRCPKRPLFNYSDLPVYQTYLEKLGFHVQKIRVVSRWLNAVSVEASKRELEQIQKLPFVQKIDPLWVGQRIKRDQLEKTATPKQMLNKNNIDTSFYGESFTQLDLIKVPVLHEKGLHGEDIVIALLDDGFNLLYDHEAFDSLQVLATYDFVHGDEDVADGGNQASEGWHGTLTLSTIAGYVPTKLIGPAYRASYLLAKTEVDQSETPVEEDYWVAGIEWAEAQGADIVSSSLGYIDWYTPEDMDGQTAKTTIAADLAVEKGVIVFNSAGNEGYNPNNNTLIAPADGKKVLAVAAVNEDGFRVSFSSVGPTADGRIKPDLAAMGKDVFMASYRFSSSYEFHSGTSFSCPLAAGGTALLLQAFPQTTPELMAKALKATASQADVPDNYLGWGIINLEKAYHYLDTANVVYIDSSQFQYPLSKDENLMVYPGKPNPAVNWVKIPFRLLHPSLVQVEVYDINGRKIYALESQMFNALQLHFAFLNINHLASGTYFYLIKAKNLDSGRMLKKGGKLIVLH